MAEISYQYSDFTWENLERTLNEMGARMVEFMRDKLENTGNYGRINASGKLSNSITHIVSQDGQNWEVSISLEDYWKYVEYDTKPHWVSAKKIQEWIIVKPIIPELRNGYLPTVEQLSHMIKWKIHEEGTKAQKFFWNSVDEAARDFEKAIEEAIELDMERNVETMLLPLQF